MNPKLEAMQRAMMVGATSVTRTVPTERLQSNPSTDQVAARANAIIAKLRAALAAEHKGRLVAEARLRDVLAEVAKRQPGAVKVVNVNPSDVTPSAPAPASIIDLSDVRAAIRAVGGDESDQEESEG